MKREDFEKNLDLLSFDEIEEDDFMLNTPTRENKDIFDMALDFIEEDNIVDTQAEQDLLTGVELDEMIDLPQINVEVLEDALMLEPEVTKVPEKEEILEFDIEEEIEIPAIEIEIKEEPKKVPNIEVEVFEMNEEVKEELKEDDKIELKEELSLPEEKEEKVKALEELEPKVTPIKANKEEREAYVLSNLKEIKKIKDEVIREVKLKQLAAETRISLAELEKRLEKLPQPRKVSSKNEEPSLAEAKIEPQLEVEADKIKEENKKASNIEVEVFEIKEEEPKEEVKEAEKEEEPKKGKKAKKEKKEKKNKKEKKPVEKNKFYYMQLVFVIISILFILGCCVFYGTRLVKYYKIYNPKNENGEKVSLLGSTIASSSSVATEGSGLYKDSVHYVFKGSEVDNYVKYRNQLWRIIKIYQDGSTELVLDNAHNMLMFNKEYSSYKDSDIRQFLNNEYVKGLNLSDLANVSFCEDTIDDITKVTCETSYDEDYVRLLGINDFINSKVDNSTFINIEENVWLYNTSSDKVWNTNGANISNADATSNFYVKPVIRLKNSTPLLGGKGTKENPYIVDNTSKNPEIGSVVKLDEDVFNIIKIEDKKAYLALNKNISTTFRFDTESNVYNLESASSAASYLNNSYLNSLSYKDALVEGTFYTGSYTTSYKDITKTNVKAKVGMLSILDPQIGSKDTRYYLITGAEEGFAYYNNYGILSKSKINISREIRPVVVINIDKLKVGEGTSEVPYTMEG